MNDSKYKKRLAEDLPGWRDKGWITKDGEAAILASLPAGHAPGFGLAAVVAVLGTLLIGFGIFAFVGANWDYMPRFFRFLLLVALIGAAYGGGAFLQSRNLPRFADAAVLLGGFAFAAGIALVGQTYHMAGEFADAILLWLVGALAAALLTRSVSGTVLALAGAVYWTWVVTVESKIGPHFGGLLAVLIGGSIAVWLDSRMARVAAILALGFWIVVTTMHLGSAYNWPAQGYMAMLACIALTVWTAGLAMTTLPKDKAPRTIKMGHDLLTPALGGFILAAGFLQVALEFSSGSDNTVWIGIAVASLVAALVLAGLAQQRGALRFVDVAAVAALGGAVICIGLWNDADDFGGRLAAGTVVILGALWWISLGHAGHPIGNKLGLFAFGAEVLYLYAVTLGSLIDTALAFLVGGVLFIALAFLLFRLDKRLAVKTAGAAA
ncbi:membrane protein [Terrihabitans soli]|uniref:Membrane protein n=1 Tax=Terrihabitans soli TaxID=708113 RepID=A0A6S6QKX9_9HYPH|nr:DUF2157 domain-containing protein [Terrihabitans soli]BCJ91973.1 membrane protein [Terrihabitans soli]